LEARAVPPLGSRAARRTLSLPVSTTDPSYFLKSRVHAKLLKPPILKRYQTINAGLRETVVRIDHTEAYQIGK
jgi:hypothetical protein